MGRLGLGLGSEPHVVGRLESGPRDGAGVFPGDVFGKWFSLGELSPGGGLIAIITILRQQSFTGPLFHNPDQPASEPSETLTTLIPTTYIFDKKYFTILCKNGKSFILTPSVLARA